jgi:hypothetical protein
MQFVHKEMYFININIFYLPLQNDRRFESNPNSLRNGAITFLPFFLPIPLEKNEEIT